MQSSAKADRASEDVGDRRDTGLSDCFGSNPLGRPKCESRITLPPLSAISLIVGATRSMRVVSVTLPFSTGTLRSTRTSTRLSPPRLDRGPDHDSRGRARAVAAESRAWRAEPKDDNFTGIDTSQPHAPIASQRVRSTCPSQPRCRPCGWRSPIHCRTRTSPAPACRPSPWSGRWRTRRSGRRD